MQKKIDVNVVARGVVDDMKFFFPQWFRLFVKLSGVWGLLQIVFYRIFWDSSLEGFLSVVSYGWVVEVFTGGSEETNVWRYGLFIVMTVVSGFFVQSSVGSAFCVYGKRDEGGKVWSLWDRRTGLFLKRWVVFYGMVIVVSFLMVFAVVLGVGLVWGVLGLGSSFGVSFGMSAILVYGVSCYVAMRFCLIFVGFAEGEVRGFSESWRLTKGQGVSLFWLGIFVFLVPPFVSFFVVFVFGFLVVMIGGSGDVIVIFVGLVSFLWGLLMSMVPTLMLMSVVMRIREKV